MVFKRYYYKTNRSTTQKLLKHSTVCYYYYRIVACQIWKLDSLTFRRVCTSLNRGVRVILHLSYTTHTYISICNLFVPCTCMTIKIYIYIYIYIFLDNSIYLKENINDSR